MNDLKEKNRNHVIQHNANEVKGREPQTESILKQKKITILLVDDEGSVLRIMSRIVKSIRHGFFRRPKQLRV